VNAPARSEATAGGAQLRYSFPATPENVEQFIADIHEFLAERNLGGLAFDMELLAREALVNAVQHGSASDPTKTVHASLSLAQGRLELVVRDEGPGWDWRAMPAQPPDPSSECGRGLFIMRKYSDGFSYNDPGNVLTIVKHTPVEGLHMSDDTTIHMALEARVAAQDVPALRETLRAHVQGGAKQIHLDCSKLESLDSMGIGLLVATHNSLGKQGGALHLTGVRKDIYHLLTLMRLDKHFSITPAKGE